MTDPNKTKGSSNPSAAPPRPSSSGSVATADPGSPMPPKPVFPGRSSSSATPPPVRSSSRAPERPAVSPEAVFSHAQDASVIAGAEPNDTVTIHTFEDLLADLDLLSPNREAPAAASEAVHQGGSSVAKLPAQTLAKAKSRTVRGMRIPLALPVQVRNKPESPKAFDEITRTVFVMSRGAVIGLSGRVSVGEVITVVNPAFKKETLCEVVDIQIPTSGKPQVEVEFVQPTQDFWPVTFPTDDSESARLTSAPISAKPAPAVQPPLQQKAPSALQKSSVAPPVTQVTKPSAPAVVPPPVKAPDPVAPVMHAKSAQKAPAPISEPPAGSNDLIDLATLILADDPKRAEAKSSTPAHAPAATSHSSLATASHDPEWPAPASAPSELPIELSSFRADRAISDIRLVHESKPGKNWLVIGFGVAALVAVAAGGMFWYRTNLAKSAASAAANPPAVTAPPVPTGALPAVTNSQPVVPAPQPPPSNASNTQSKSVNPAPSNTAAQNNTKPPVKDASSDQPVKPAPAKASATNSRKPKMPANLTSAVVPTRRASSSDGDPIAAPSIGNGAPNMAAMGGIVPGTNLGSPSQPQVQAPLPVGGHVQAPRLVSSTSPIYPAIARRNRVEGDVVVDTTIDANGKVMGMKIISGPAMLQEAAKDALRQWRYSPGSLNGQAIPTQMQVTIKFRLN